MRLRLLLAFFFALPCACSSSTSPVDAGSADSAGMSDASTGPDAVAESSTDAAMEAATVCNTLANTAAVVSVQTAATAESFPFGPFPCHSNNA